MYLDHFGLHEAPFRITPHTDFFFGGGNRGATLDALLYAITHDEGIVKVSGEVGSGKTMLCRVLMDRLPDTVTIIYLANPSLSREDILFAIAHELRIIVATDARAAVVLRALQEHLIHLYGEGRQVVVLIDEAHAMPTETLEEIRLLSNLESNRNKLLQLVLFGQPELNEILARPNMRQLKERVTHNFALEPLVRDEIASYLDFRLRAAGYKGPNPFDAKAVQTIARVSQGLTRRINILADKCLLASFSSGHHHVGKRELQAAVQDCDFSSATMPSKRRGISPRTRQGLTISLAIILGAALMTLFYGVRPSLVGERTTKNPAVAAQQETLQPEATDATPPISAPSIPLPPPVAISSTPLAAAPVNTVSTTRTDGTGELTKITLAAGLSWLERADNSHWFLQLIATDGAQTEAVEVFLRKAKEAELNFTNLRTYHAQVNAKTRYGVIYGEYPTRAAAIADLRRLPSAIKIANPFPRQVKQLR